MKPLVEVERRGCALDLCPSDIERLTLQPFKPDSVYIKDTYTSYDPVSGALSRLRKATWNDKTQYAFQSKSPVPEYPSYSFEMKRLIGKADYEGLVASIDPVLVLEGKRQEMWYDEDFNPYSLKTEKSLHISLDNVVGHHISETHNLGTWIEAELEVPVHDNPDKMSGLIVQASAYVTNILRKLSIRPTDLTYADMLLDRCSNRDSNLVTMRSFARTRHP
jgi:hypothetical protein